MPAMPPVPNVLKVQLTWIDEFSATSQTVHHFHYTGGTPTSANCTTMASNIVAEADTAFAPVTLAVSGMHSATVTDLSSPTSGQGEGGTPWVGTLGGTRVAPGSAYVVNHSIGRRYRGGKPRSYLPVGRAEDIDTPGTWTAASVANVDAAWGSWVAQVLAHGVGCTIDNIVNVSYFSGFTVVTSPTTGRSRNVPKLRAEPIVDVILGHTTSTFIGSQRRRNRRA